MKFIILFVLFYLAYLTIVKPMLPSGRSPDNTDEVLDDGEYIDYEEVD